MIDDVYSRRFSRAECSPAAPVSFARPPHILVAADQPAVIRGVCYLLPNLGYQVVTLFDEGQAVAQILGHSDEHNIVVTGDARLDLEDDGLVSRPLVSARHLIERLRSLHYSGAIHWCCSRLALGTCLFCEDHAVDRLLIPGYSDFSLLESIRSLAQSAQAPGECLSILDLNEYQ